MVVVLPSGASRLGLADDKVLEVRLVLIWSARLLGKISQHLFRAGGAVALVLDGFVEAAWCVFDALHRADRVLRVQLRLVDARSPDKQLRQALLVGADQQRCPPAPAQYLEAAERAPHLQGHQDAWKQVNIVTEIACCEFTEPVKAQGDLFDLLIGKAAA